MPKYSKRFSTCSKLKVTKACLKMPNKVVENFLFSKRGNGIPSNTIYLLVRILYQRPSSDHWSTLGSHASIHAGMRSSHQDLLPGSYELNYTTSHWYLRSSSSKVKWVYFCISTQILPYFFRKRISSIGSKVLSRDADMFAA